MTQKRVYEKGILRNPWIFAVFFTSFTFLMVSAGLAIWAPKEQFIIIMLSQFSSAVFFPILVGFFYERFKRKQEGETIWGVFKEFSDGGILRVYKDREENDSEENALQDLRKAFETHNDGTIKLIGVSLRVFFNQPGPFYRSITTICDLHKYKKNVSVKALISSPDSPETLNRARIETPGRQSDPLIKIDMKSTIESILNLKKNYGEESVEYKTYLPAPYCTAIIFPGKCYFSPNILSVNPPVRLPMIVFRQNSHGYEKINDYFDYLWNLEQQKGEEN